MRKVRRQVSGLRERQVGRQTVMQRVRDADQENGDRSVNRQLSTQTGRQRETETQADTRETDIL